MNPKDKAEKLYEAVTQLDDETVLEAEQTRFPKKKKVWLRWAALAAACVIVAGASWIRFQTRNRPDFTEKPETESTQETASALTPSETTDEVSTSETADAGSAGEAAECGMPENAAGSEETSMTAADTAEDKNDMTSEDSAFRSEIAVDLRTGSRAAADFGLQMLSNVHEEGGNVSVSPVSVLTALGMTANGARGETRAQIEQAVGLRSEELDAVLAEIRGAFSRSTDARLLTADAVWFREDGFEADPAFLKRMADFYNADIHSIPFDDTAKEAINRWVKQKTEDMIPEIITALPPRAVMVLADALAFDAEWAEPYTETQIRKGVFTTASGEAREVDYLASAEAFYLENDDVTGVIKYYKGGDYAFAALLPREGSTPEEVLNQLDGEAFLTLLENRTDAEVAAWIPEFEADFEAELSETLAGMGMPDLFDEEEADLSGLGTAANNLFVSGVYHRTYIKVDRKGTKAAAATAVVVEEDTGMLIADYYEVVLSRPFIYALIDTKTNVPFFLGILEDPATE